MTIENLKQIAIKYATTKGSRVPLAPDELCNAVVQYFNEFLKITADINTIQVAVTEEGGNIVFTITGNTLDGKAFTPIVITVDHNEFVTNQEFEEFKTTTNAAIQKNTESINSLSFRVEDTENDITTIQVQVGQINTRVGNTETDVTNLKNRVDNTETNIAKINSTLNNKLDKVSSTTGVPQVYVKEYNGTQTMLDLSESTRVNSIPKRGTSGRMYTNDGISSEPSSVANMRNIADVEAKIPSTDNFLLKNAKNIINYSKFKIIDEIGSNLIGKEPSNNNMSIGSSNYAMQLNSSIRPIIYTPAATYEVAYTRDIPKYTNVDSVSYDSTNGAIVAYDGANEIHIPLLAGDNVTIDASEDNRKIVISAAGGGGTGDVTAAGNNIFTGENEFRNYTYDTSYFCFVDTKENYLTNGYTTTIKNGGFDISYYENGEGKYWTTYADNQIINKDIDMEGEVVIKFPKKGGTFALTSDIPDIPKYTNVDSVSYDSTNGAIVAYDGANEIHIPLLAGENVTIDASEDNKKIVISAAGGGGAGDVTAAGNNTFTGENTFNNSIYAKNGIVAGDTTNYGANSVTKGSNTYSFPNKSGTFAMANDIINEPIYFISFYANDPSEPCHLIGTIMSKNSYGTGQKTNEEFAVMLADNFYVNSNEGLAAYGRLANKDILCIYSEDGLSIRCLDEENSEVDLPTVMFFVMETEL